MAREGDTGDTLRKGDLIWRWKSKFAAQNLAQPSQAYVQKADQTLAVFFADTRDTFTAGEFVDGALPAEAVKHVYCEDWHDTRVSGKGSVWMLAKLPDGRTVEAALNPKTAIFFETETDELRKGSEGETSRLESRISVARLLGGFAPLLRQDACRAGFYF